MTERQNALFKVVTKYHDGQIRKYTGEPYWQHLINVAKLVKKYVDVPLAFEAALCHDLFEDTECKPVDLFDVLRRIGYSYTDTGVIMGNVVGLTDLFTKEAQPNLNRQQRKRMEATRLGATCPTVQSIKYADLIDNTWSIVQHDRNFAKVYLAEKKMYLDHMRKGCIELYLRAAWHLQSGLMMLEANVNTHSELGACADDAVRYSKPVTPIQSKPYLPPWGDDLD